MNSKKLLLIILAFFLFVLLVVTVLGFLNEPYKKFERIEGESCVTYTHECRCFPLVSGIVDTLPPIHNCDLGFELCKGIEEIECW